MKLKMLESLLSTGSHAGYQLVEIDLERAAKLAAAAKKMYAGTAEGAKYGQQAARFGDVAKLPYGPIRSAKLATHNRPVNPAFPETPEVQQGRGISSAFNRAKRKLAKKTVTPED